MVFGRKKKDHAPGDFSDSTVANDEAVVVDGPTNGIREKHDPAVPLPKSTLKRATRTRKTWSLLSAFFLFISLIFIILVEIGNTYVKPVLTNTYWLRLDLANVIPESVPNSALINTIAQTLGLHDYYQFGLWNFCQGYVDQGITECSDPQTLYWFNPVEIILNQLLAGATIAIPAEAVNYLNILMIASKVMFILFIVGACLTALNIILLPTNIYSRWVSFLMVILVFLSAACICIGSAIGTAISIIFRDAITQFNDLNIGAEVGTQMFAFAWVASAFQLLAFITQLCLCCCCASRRDVKRGKKTGSKKAYM